MTYHRVLPRDLFNEANLLKCIGKLVLLIEDGEIDFLQYHYDGEAFNICQNDASGGLFVANIEFWFRGDNKPIDGALHFERPLNSRAPWPLYLETDQDLYEVFDDSGNCVLDISSIQQS